MKRIGLAGFLAMVAVLVLLAGKAGAQQTKIGVVDVNKVFSEYYKVAETQKDFDKIREEKQAEVEKRADEIQKSITPLQKKQDELQDKLDKQGKALSKEKTEELKNEIDKVKEEIDKKRQEALGYQREVYQELQQKNRELVEARVKEITECITKLGKEKGFSAVIHKDAILYSPDEADLTAAVLEALNKEAPKPEAAAAKPETKKDSKKK